VSTWQKRDELAGGRRLPVFAATAVLLMVLAACTGSDHRSASGSAVSTGAASGAPATTAAGLAGGTAGSLQQQYESVIRQVLPSIVEITTNEGLGSGIVFDTAGDIVTNAHVVGTATQFQVRLANRASSVPAKLVATFEANDLAVIKVSGAADLRPARFADSAKTKVGQIVLAMGNPLGLSSSVTEGIVSAVGRTLTEPSGPGSPGATLPDAIQTSAAINPGNSGGALVDLRGEVVGIPTLAATSQQDGGAAPGIGFAIPSNTVTNIAKQLIKDGKVTHSGRAALGVQVATVTGPSGAPAGAGVVEVIPGGGAAEAGIRAGDLITKVDGTEVTSAQDLSAQLTKFEVGQTVEVTVQRDGSEDTLKVTLGQLTS
jgi:S1-C subfamily serine protease